jgi:hypothetical protein
MLKMAYGFSGADPMRYPLRVLILLAMIIVSLASPAVLVAQSVDFGSTPEAPSGPRDASTGDNVPTFAMFAVGDYPTGYFDDIEMAPGTSIELTVALVNAGMVPVDLHSFKVNANVGINGGFQAGEEDDPPVGATAWINYPPQDFQLAPGEQQAIAFTVSVPADAQPGQYIAGLAATEAESAPIPGTDIISQTRGYVISVGILVPGEITPSFGIDEPRIDNRALTIPVSNSGNHLVRPAGQLEMVDANGNLILATEVRMGSVYAGLSTNLVVYLPDQLPAGDFSVNLKLTDEASGASAEIVDAPVTLAEPVDPTALTATVTVEPNADPIAFANVTAVINNPGREIPAANVSLIVLRDGQEIEIFPLASNLLVQTGEATVSGRYIPEDAWSSGTYTFQVVVSSVSQREGTETVLLTVEVDGEIVIP